MRSSAPLYLLSSDPKRDLRCRYALLACLGVSVLMHAAMLTMSDNGTGTATQTGVVEAFVVQLGSAVMTTGAVPLTQPVPAQNLPQLDSRRSPPPAMLPPPTAGFSVAHFDESAYLPGKLLTVRPTAARYISVPYPLHVKPEGTWKAKLLIFIDEDGTVAKLRVENLELPDPFAQAAINAFGRATFHPGKVGDKPVKARLLVEVEFDSGPPLSDEPSRIASLPGTGKPSDQSLPP
jgi:hypothetical protein